VILKFKDSSSGKSGVEKLKAELKKSEFYFRKIWLFIFGF